MAIEVRAATQADSDAMLRLSLAARIKAYDNQLGDESRAIFLKKHILTPHRLGNFSASLQKYLKQPDSYRAYVVTDDESVRGYIKITVSDESLYVANLYVDPEVQGRGYGGLLMERLFDLAEGRSITLDVVATNAGAIRFYTRHGFNKIPSHKKSFYGLPVIRLKKEP